MKKSIVILLISVGLSLYSFGQTPPHPNGGGGPGGGNTPVGGGAPIDGGMVILFSLSVFYSLNRFTNIIHFKESKYENI